MTADSALLAGGPTSSFGGDSSDENRFKKDTNSAFFGSIRVKSSKESVSNKYVNNKCPYKRILAQKSVACSLKCNF